MHLEEKPIEELFETQEQLDKTIKQIRGKREHEVTRRDKKVLAYADKLKQKEHRRSALIHKLAEQADKWGRKTISACKAEVGSAVQELDRKQLVLVKEVKDLQARKEKALRAACQKSIQAIQDKLQRDLEALQKQTDKGLDKISTEYAPAFEACADRESTEIDGISNRVGSFTGCLESLSLEQLEELEKKGQTTACIDGIANTVKVPGAKA